LLKTCNVEEGGSLVGKKQELLKGKRVLRGEHTEKVWAKLESREGLTSSRIETEVEVSEADGW